MISWLSLQLKSHQMPGYFVIAQLSGEHFLSCTATLLRATKSASPISKGVYSSLSSLFGEPILVSTCKISWVRELISSTPCLLSKVANGVFV